MLVTTANDGVRSPEFEPRVSHTGGSLQRVEFERQALFLPAKAAYHFNNVRYNRIHPIEDAAQLVVYKQQPFFLILLLTILALGIMAVGLEFVYILRSKKRIQALRRVLFIHTGDIREESALMVARGVPWIDFSKPGKRVTMQHVLHIAVVHVPMVAAFLTILPSRLWGRKGGKRVCWRSSDRVMLESLQAGSTRIALLLTQLLAILVSEGFFAGQNVLGNSQDVFLWLFERLFVSAVASVISLPAYALIPEIFYGVNHVDMENTDSTESQTCKAKLLRALPLTTLLYMFEPPNVSLSSLSQPDANQVVPHSIQHQATLEAEIVDSPLPEKHSATVLPHVTFNQPTLHAEVVHTPLRESHKQDTEIFRIVKPTRAKRPVLKRIKIERRPSQPSKRDSEQKIIVPFPKVAKPAIQRMALSPSPGASHYATATEMETREVVWVEWQDNEAEHVYRTLMSILGWTAIVFFFGYYAYLVLVFGATLSSDKMLTWLRKSSVSIFLSEFVITGVVLAIKLLVSYVAAKMLWSMNRNKTHPLSVHVSAADIADSLRGPRSLQKVSVRPVIPKKRRLSSRSGTTIKLTEMEV